MEEMNEKDLDAVLESIKKKEIDMGIQIVNLQAEIDHLKGELKECVNELCYMCGSYKYEHEGTCNDCKYLPLRKGK